MTRGSLGRRIPDRRWDTDERGTGVRDATAFGEPVRRLLETVATPGWVAEEPEAHLLPHLEATVAERDLALVDWRDDDGVLELTVSVGDRPRQAQRAAAYALVAAIAEASTHIREVERDVFEVITGMLPGDGSFATHGHVLRVRTTAGSEQ